MDNRRKNPFRKLFKELFKSRLLRTIICFLASVYIRFITHTSRVHMDVHPLAVPYLTVDKTSIWSFWHGRLLMIPPLHPAKPVHVLISSHRDGELIARTVAHFGFSAVRGSSTRGGAGAAKQALRALKAGDNVAFTPDGPKGPPMVLQPGVLRVAETARVAILPVTYSASRYRRMRSWDRFMVPLPFGNIYYGVGMPMENPTAEQLENEMVRITREADIKAGVH